MRLPVDQVAAKVMLVGGKSFDGSLFIAIGEDIITVFTKPDAFIPVACDQGILLVAREAIAAIVVRSQLVLTDDLPTEQQLARVHLRDGHTVDGELRWTAPEGRRRTADFLNDSAPYIVVHGREGMTYIAKRAVAWLEEQ